MADHINLQTQKTSKIFGIVKTGANRTDINIIKALQSQGYTEHEIEKETGVGYRVVQSFMLENDPEFKKQPAPATPETQPLLDEIARLKEENEEIARLKEENEEIARLKEENEEIARLREENVRLAEEYKAAAEQFKTPPTPSGDFVAETDKAPKVKTMKAKKAG